MIQWLIIMFPINFAIEGTTSMMARWSLVNLFSVLREPESLAGSLACHGFSRRPGRNFHQSRSNREKNTERSHWSSMFRWFFFGFFGFYFSFLGIFDDFWDFLVATRVDPTARTTYCTGMQQLLGACPGGGRGKGSTLWVNWVNWVNWMVKHDFYPLVN